MAHILHQQIPVGRRDPLSRLGEAGICTRNGRLKARALQAHTVIFPTKYPLKQALQKANASGRLSRWVVELAEFDIHYRPRTAIKGQVVADFLAEFIYDPQPDGLLPSEEPC